MKEKDYTITTLLFVALLVVLGTLVGCSSDPKPQTLKNVNTNPSVNANVNANINATANTNRQSAWLNPSPAAEGDRVYGRSGGSQARRIKESREHR